MISLLLIAIVILSFLDITLTYYTFYLDNKKGVFKIEDENNIFIKFILRTWGLTPRSYLITFFAIQDFLMILWYYVPSQEIFGNVLVGMFLVVFLIHSKNIGRNKKYWNNTMFWKKLKELHAVMKYEEI